MEGLNLYVSPFLHKEGDLIRAVNVDNFPKGALSKRSGYTTYLGTPDNSVVTSLFDWHRNDGTTFWTYRLSNGELYYSTQGTGAWTLCGNGTFSGGAQPGYAVLEDTMLIGDGTTLTRHTTDGTSFTNTDAAPYAQYFTEYQNRIYAGGTASDLFFSTTGSPTNWISDSSSLKIPGPGKINDVSKTQDRLVASKNSGKMFRWDGYSLADLTTDLGPSSSYAVGEIEDYRIWPNRRGLYGFNGDLPQLISNPIVRQIYNNAGSGIPGTAFDTLTGATHKYDYYLSAGTSITEDLTNETVSNCVFRYDYPQNQYYNYSLATFPTAWHSFRNNTGDEQLIFGDANGQCYTLGGTALSDNGQPINSVAEGVLHFGSPEGQNKLNYLWAFANPGCQAHIQVALSDSFTKGKLNWMSLGDFSDGVAEMRFPNNSSGRLLFWKLSESSMGTKFVFYGFVLDVELEEH